MHKSESGNQAKSFNDDLKIKGILNCFLPFKTVFYPPCTKSLKLIDLQEEKILCVKIGFFSML